MALRIPTRIESVLPGDTEREDQGVCPHCEQADGVQRYMLGQLPTAGTTEARYCSHCETRWLGKREPKAKARAAA